MFILPHIFVRGLDPCYFRKETTLQLTFRRRRKPISGPLRRWRNIFFRQRNTLCVYAHQSLEMPMRVIPLRMLFKLIFTLTPAYYETVNVMSSNEQLDKTC